MARRPSSVCPSVCLSVNFCANRFFSQTNGRIATKLAHDGLHVSVHPGCAQGQRSRDTRTFLHSWNELLRHWRSGLSIIATVRPNLALAFNGRTAVGPNAIKQSAAFREFCKCIQHFSLMQSRVETSVKNRVLQQVPRKRPSKNLCANSECKSFPQPPGNFRLASTLTA